MAGIIVLSDTLKVGSKLEKTPTLKGNDVADSSGNAAAEFAAMLSGSMNFNADLKGQNSTVEQESEEEQSAENPVSSAQNPNGSGGMPGYGYFAFPFLLQPMLQSDLPAGKEANSGDDVDQGTGNLVGANVALSNATLSNATLSNASIVSGNIDLALLNPVSLESDEVSAQSGMTMPKLQGANPSTPELDEYRQVIANLLIALSGEITDPSLEGNSLSLNSSGTMELQQKMAKIVQSWVTDDVGEDVLIANGQQGRQQLLDALTAELGADEPVLNAKVSALLAALYPKLSQASEGVEGTRASQEGMKVTDQGKEELSKAAEVKGGSELYPKQLKGTDGKAVATQGVDTALLTNVQQQAQGMKATDQGKEELSKAAEVKGGSELYPKQLKGTDGKAVATQGVDTALLTNVQQQAQGMKATDQGEEELSDGEVNGGSELYLKQQKGTDVKSVATQEVVNTALLTNVQQQAQGMKVTNQGKEELSNVVVNGGSELYLKQQQGTDGKSVVAQGVVNTAPQKNLQQQVQEMKATDQGEEELSKAEVKGGSELYLKQQKGTNVKLVATQGVANTVLQTNVQQQAQGMMAADRGKEELSNPEVKGGSELYLKQLKGTDLKPVATQRIDSAQSVELSGGKDVPTQNASASVVAPSNIITANVAEGKTVAIPIYEQISTAIREQVMNKSQDLKQLEIQLHPADLGKIQIGMRWESGQVHLVVHASEAATSQLLQSQLSDLRQNLTNQGVNCGMMQMGQGGEQKQSPQGDQSQRTFDRNVLPNEDEDLIPVTASFSPGEKETNRINVTA